MVTYQITSFINKSREEDMKRQIQLLLMITAGVLVISKAPGASASNRALMQSFCVNVTSTIPLSCACEEFPVNTKIYSGCGTKIVSVTFPCGLDPECGTPNYIQ